MSAYPTCFALSKEHSEEGVVFYRVKSLRWFPIATSTFLLLEIIQVVHVFSPNYISHFVGKFPMGFQIRPNLHLAILIKKLYSLLKLPLPVKSTRSFIMDTMKTSIWFCTLLSCQVNVMVVVAAIKASAFLH